MKQQKTKIATRNPIAGNAWKYNRRAVFANPKTEYKRVKRSQLRKEYGL